MRKQIEELKSKTQHELQKEVESLRNEISKLKLDWKVNPPKDTNMLAKKKKVLSAILYIIHEKTYTEKVNQK